MLADLSGEALERLHDQGPISEDPLPTTLPGAPVDVIAKVPIIGAMQLAVGGAR